jgi:hypothetical protein
VPGNDQTKTYDDLTALPRRFYRVVVSVGGSSDPEGDGI